MMNKNPVQGINLLQPSGFFMYRQV